RYWNSWEDVDVHRGEGQHKYQVGEEEFNHGAMRVPNGVMPNSNQTVSMHLRAGSGGFSNMPQAPLSSHVQMIMHNFFLLQWMVPEQAEKILRAPVLHASTVLRNVPSGTMVAVGSGGNVAFTANGHHGATRCAGAPTVTFLDAGEVVEIAKQARLRSNPVCSAFGVYEPQVAVRKKPSLQAHLVAFLKTEEMHHVTRRWFLQAGRLSAKQVVLLIRCRTRTVAAAVALSGTMGVVMQDGMGWGGFIDTPAATPPSPCPISNDVQLVIDNILRLHCMAPEQAAKALKDTAAMQGPYED
ncbi:SEC13, partial [Symbiodinium necroappetens]